MFAGGGVARERQLDGQVVGDLAGGENQDASGKEYGFGDGVGDEERGPSLAITEGEEFLVEVFAGEFVEGGKRLVEQEERGFEDKRAGDGDAHFFAAGKLARVTVGEVVDAREREELGGAFTTMSGGDTPEFEEQLGVVSHREPRKQRGVLKNKGALGGRVFGGMIFDEDVAGCRRGQTGEEAQEGGFPATAGADDADELAAFGAERDVIKNGRTRVVVAKALGDGLKFDDGRRNAHAGGWGSMGSRGERASLRPIAAEKPEEAPRLFFQAVEGLGGLGEGGFEGDG